jgi:hypothetical protein
MFVQYFFDCAVGALPPPACQREQGMNCLELIVTGASFEGMGQQETGNADFDR